MREHALIFGGELSITGKPGKGTTLTLRIPVKQDRRDA
jgi:signal transduction histidine kinase